MGTSFLNQIPAVLGVVQQLRPARILDVGKGFGKYGMLIHEYVGLDSQARVEPMVKIRDQSGICIDAVEPDPDLLLPHIDHYYRKVYSDPIERIYRELSGYDVILMADVIEHLEKSDGVAVLNHFVATSHAVVVSTPLRYFSQCLYQSRFEEHRSHWAARDFKRFGHVLQQRIGAGGLYVISGRSLSLRGFGNGVSQKFRRLARAIRDDWFWY